MLLDYHSLLLNSIITNILGNGETYFASRIEDEHESFYFLVSNPTIFLHLELHARML